MLLVGVSVTDARGTEANMLHLGEGGAVTSQGKDKNFSTQTHRTEREYGENVKTSSFLIVFAHKMTYFPV